MPNEITNPNRRKHDPVDSGQLVRNIISRYVHEDMVAELVHGQVVGRLQASCRSFVILESVELYLTRNTATSVGKRNLRAPGRSPISIRFHCQHTDAG